MIPISLRHLLLLGRGEKLTFLNRKKPAAAWGITKESFLGVRYNNTLNISNEYTAERDATLNTQQTNDVRITR